MDYVSVFLFVLDVCLDCSVVFYFFYFRGKEKRSVWLDSLWWVRGRKKVKLKFLDFLYSVFLILLNFYLKYLRLIFFKLCFLEI